MVSPYGPFVTSVTSFMATNSRELELNLTPQLRSVQNSSIRSSYGCTTHYKRLRLSPDPRMRSLIAETKTRSSCTQHIQVFFHLSFWNLEADHFAVILSVTHGARDVRVLFATGQNQTMSHSFGRYCLQLFCLALNHPNGDFVLLLLCQQVQRASTGPCVQ